MASLKERVYWRAPGFLKNLMASWHARHLDRQRFGPAYEQALGEIATRDGWSAEQFAEYQRQALRALVRHAARTVPYYRRAFMAAGVDVESIRAPEDLPGLPILEKEPVRADPVSLVDETLDRRRLLVGNTSGTTGTPLKLYRDVALHSAAFAYFDARCRDVAGVRRRRNRSVSVGVYLVTAPGRTKPPFWVHNRHWKQMYMSCYHLSPLYLGAYVEEIRRFRPEYIEGYPSSVYAIARHIIEEGLDPIPMKACFSTAETLFDHHRQAIGKAFGCQTYNQYGCGEYVAFAAECEQGTMHLSPDYGIVEVVDEHDQPLPPGHTGQLICTSLINRVQPFIRYRIGDVGALGTGPCSCGRPFGVLERVDGRTDHLLFTLDGRRIGRLDAVLKDVEHVGECQIVQDEVDAFRIRVVPAPGYRDSDGARLVSNLASRVGRANIRVVLENSIERTSAGKFLAAVCRLTPEQVASVQTGRAAAVGD